MWTARTSDPARHWTPLEGTMKRNTKKRTIIASLAAIGMMASTVVIANVATAGHPEASLPGSDFEIDEDANLKTDDGPPSLDWGNVTQTRGTDLPTGKNDDSFKGGTKEDTECPAQVTGSIPNNKSDLLTIDAYTEAGDPGFFNFAWSRVSDPSGTTLMDFEFNQSPTMCPAGSPNLERTVDDLLIEYAIDQGGARAAVFVRTWDGAAWGPAEALDASTACGGGPCAVGTISQSVIPAVDSDGLGEKQPRTFGEAQLDLRFIFDDAKCVSFGSVMVKSRSSNAFSSQLKDFITPIPIDLTNCGKVIVRKQTDPDGATETFNFSKAFGTDPASSDTFSLADDGVKTFDGVLFGDDLTVTELATPTGYDFVSVDCSASTGVVGNVAGTTVTFDIDSPTDILDCTYLNRARASLTIEKQTDPDGDTTSFGFDGDFGPFNLADDDDTTFGNLSPATYAVSEDTPPNGWTLTSFNCDNGDTADAVTLVAGDDVTCVAVNTGRGGLTVVKDAERSGVLFDFTTDVPPFDEATQQLADTESFSSSDVAPGTYSTSETVPAGWNLTSFNCDNADTADAVTVGVGDDVTCTAINVIERGAISIHKTAKNAAAGGEMELAGVEFTVSNTTNGTNVKIVTDEFGDACVDGLPVSVLDGDYDLVETVPDGYAGGADQTYTVIEGTCGTDPVAAEFVNTPLSNVTFSVDSQVDGGTFSVLSCEDGDGNVTSLTTDGDGDGSITIYDLEPTDPAITLTCTIVIDP